MEKGIIGIWTRHDGTCVSIVLTGRPPTSLESIIHGSVPTAVDQCGLLVHHHAGKPSQAAEVFDLGSMDLIPTNTTKLGNSTTN